MTRFLIAFFLVYSGINAFFYSRIRVLLPEKWAIHGLVIIFLALMVFAPVGTRLLEGSGRDFPARISAVIGYCWLGYVFYAFWCFLIVAIVGAVFKLLDYYLSFSLPLLNGAGTALCVLAAVLAINVYGYFEARSIRVEKIVIRTAKLPPGTERLRIAQISDVHLGLLLRGKRLADILGKVEAENPDILVSTGDLVDGNMEKIDGLPAMFGKLRPRLGKYAITGNHEVYAGLSEALAAEKSFGFVMLSGEVKTVGNVLNIVGVDDPATGLPEDEKHILEKAQNGLFTLFLKHRPDPLSETLGLYDLQLSGHTHYGQLFPFRLISGLFYPLQNGPYFLPKGSILYTSRGSGTWGPPIRVLAPPEVTIFDIVRE